MINKKVTYHNVYLYLITFPSEWAAHRIICLLDLSNIPKSMSGTTTAQVDQDNEDRDNAEDDVAQSDSCRKSREALSSVIQAVTSPTY